MPVYEQTTQYVNAYKIPSTVAGKAKMSQWMKRMGYHTHSWEDDGRLRVDFGTRYSIYPVGFYIIARTGERAKVVEPDEFERDYRRSANN